MLAELIQEVAALVLMITFGYAAVYAYVIVRHPHLSGLLARRRLAVLAALMLVIVGVKVFEDVLGQESAVIDERLLWFVHDHIPPALDAFFAAVTRAGSAAALVPAAAVIAAALAFYRRRFEAVLVVASLGTSVLLVFALKTAIGRVRPALWDTQWFWGSSFPSGHTTNTAAVSTALALALARIWPRSAGWAMAAALAWTSLVALSRMVLGVHWPSDVLAALCLGMLIPLMMSLGFELYAHSWPGAHR
jgi:undecaprenyl-diphosphatase